MDEVCFQYPSSSGFFTAEIASNSLARLTEVYNDKHATSWPVHESIKEYAESPLEYQRMVKLLEEKGREEGLVIHAQREDIFNAMHRI